jgi:hypothetical protein
MALLESAIASVLLGATSITHIVDTRIRPLAMASDDVRPYIVYQVTDGKTESTLDASIDPDDYQKAEFELGIYGDDYPDVMEISRAARTLFDHFGQTVAGIEFAPSEFESETDIEQVVPEGKELPVFLRVQTYKVLYRSV